MDRFLMQINQLCVSQKCAQVFNEVFFVQIEMNFIERIDEYELVFDEDFETFIVYKGN